jgi:hypothetical protein
LCHALSSRPRALADDPTLGFQHVGCLKRLSEI